MHCDYDVELVIQEKTHIQVSHLILQPGTVVVKYCPYAIQLESARSRRYCVSWHSFYPSLNQYTNMKMPWLQIRDKQYLMPNIKYRTPRTNFLYIYHKWTTVTGRILTPSERDLANLDSLSTNNHERTHAPEQTVFFPLPCLQISLKKTPDSYYFGLPVFSSDHMQLRQYHTHL